MQYVLGKGDKSTYLTQRFLSALEVGGGAYLTFSPTDILDSIPKERWDDVILFEGVGFNYLEPTHVLESLKSAWHYDGSTPILDLYTYNSVATLSHVPDASLLGVIYLLTDTQYRKRAVSFIKDRLLQKFWRDFDAIPTKEQRQQTLSTLNKFYALFTDPVYRRVLGQKRTSFKVKDTSILIGQFEPNEKGSFLSTLLLHYLPDFPIILDGGHRLGPRAVMEKQNLTFSHDYLEQLTKPMQETLIGSADSLVAFRLGPTDAERLTVEFDLGQTQWSLTELPPQTYHLKTHKTYPDQEVPEPTWPLYDTQKLRNISNSKYGRPNADATIERFLCAYSGSS